MNSLVSVELAAMVRPRVTYRRLGADPYEDWSTAAGRAALMLLVLGTCVSLTGAGRISLSQVLLDLPSWGFVPLLQLVVPLLVARLVGSTVARGRVASLYLLGNGPWLVALLSIAAMVLVAPDVYVAATFLLSSGILPGFLVVVFFWSVALTYFFFREGLGLSRSRAGVGTGLQYGFTLSLVLSYFFATNQIQPHL